MAASFAEARGTDRAVRLVVTSRAIAGGHDASRTVRSDDLRTDAPGARGRRRRRAAGPGGRRGADRGGERDGALRVAAGAPGRHAGREGATRRWPGAAFAHAAGLVHD